MKNTIKELINDKRVLILGFGREGQSSFRQINEIGGYSALDIADAKPLSIEVDSKHKAITGEAYLSCLNDYDVVLKSPGIVLPKSLDHYTCYITCQADLFLQVYGKQTVGITGTKGKSTTSSLLYHILKENGLDVIFGGNIGVPILDTVDDIKENTIVVFELSCHQLEYAGFAPGKAVLLNLYEDHLDHYGSVEKYWNAKKNIYRNQDSNDVLYTNPDVVLGEGECFSKVVYPSISDLPFESFNDIKGCMLRGSHNLYNTAFVYDIAKSFGVSDEGFKSALASFKTLAHRLEYLGQLNGVDYYDDSISTTVESTISAIKAIDNAGILLLGGMDRGIDYDPLVSFLLETSLDYIILMYDSGHTLQEKLSHCAGPGFMDRIHYIHDLKDACEYAKLHATEGKAVILSPAAASYGVFKNFEERGDKFKEYIFGGMSC
ncbi:MAG: UDP-N-acetylmuramoyl-L-alanine--D-glutamate ligase [Pseudobutyrivibrio sp.]|nr:UDP-N-acetylmuramoyl-L-alanine--D-glutamate ligase [Pseudobutyrivibrio sp.]